MGLVPRPSETLWPRRATHSTRPVGVPTFSRVPQGRGLPGGHVRASMHTRSRALTKRSTRVLLIQQAAGRAGGVRHRFVGWCLHHWTHTTYTRRLRLWDARRIQVDFLDVAW